MSFSFVSHLVCPKCSKTYDHNKLHQLCTCGSPLLVDYDLERLKEEDVIIDQARNDLWRYHKPPPVTSEEHVVSLGEGMTPLLPMPELGAELGIQSLFMKDEGLIPTGSFKARGSGGRCFKSKRTGSGPARDAHQWECGSRMVALLRESRN